MSQVYMFKHNVDTAQIMHTPFRFRIYCIFERFTVSIFLNEYTHMSKCVCMDTRLEYCSYPDRYVKDGLCMKPYISYFLSLNHYHVYST